MSTSNPDLTLHIELLDVLRQAARKVERAERDASIRISEHANRLYSRLLDEDQQDEFALRAAHLDELSAEDRYKVLLDVLWCCIANSHPAVGAFACPPPQPLRLVAS